MNPLALKTVAIVWVALGLADAVAAERVRLETLLTERFTGASASGWTFDKPEVWSIRNGRLRAVLPDKKQEKSLAYFGSEEWTDYVVDLDVCGVRGVDKGVAIRVDGDEGIGVDLRGPGYGDVVLYRGTTQLGKQAVPNRNGRWNHLRVEAEGNRYRVFVNGRLKIEYVDEQNQRPTGRLALAAYTGGAGECEVMYDNVVVRRPR